MGHHLVPIQFEMDFYPWDDFSRVAGCCSNNFRNLFEHIWSTICQQIFPKALGFTLVSKSAGLTSGMLLLLEPNGMIPVLQWDICHPMPMPAPSNGTRFLFHDFGGIFCSSLFLIYKILQKLFQLHQIRKSPRELKDVERCWQRREPEAFPSAMKRQRLKKEQARGVVWIFCNAMVASHN